MKSQFLLSSVLYLAAVLGFSLVVAFRHFNQVGMSKRVADNEGRNSQSYQSYHTSAKGMVFEYGHTPFNT